MAIDTRPDPDHPVAIGRFPEFMDGVMRIQILHAHAPLPSWSNSGVLYQAPECTSSLQSRAFSLKRHLPWFKCHGSSRPHRMQCSFKRGKRCQDLRLWHGKGVPALHLGVGRPAIEANTAAHSDHADPLAAQPCDERHVGLALASCAHKLLGLGNPPRH